MIANPRYCTAVTLASQLGLEVHGDETRVKSTRAVRDGGEGETQARAHGRVGGGWAVSRGVPF